MNEALLQAINDVFGRPDVWLIIIASACYGIFVGAIPGLTATMAVALFVPMAYWLDPVSAVAAIVSMVACAIFAGDLPTVFLRIPGTPASAAYADDAYDLARSGQAQRLLGVALTCSVTGGIAGAIVLMLLGGQLAKVARWFSVTEYFWLYLIGLGCAVLVAPGGARWKALLALLLGLLLSTVGLSAAHIEPRFTFGMPSLYQGISFIPAMIGLFGLSEVFTNLSSDPRRGTHAKSGDALSFAGTLRQVRSDAMFRIRHRKAASTRSSLLGVLIGMLPGAGADIAAWVAFAVAKRPRSKKQANKGPVNDRQRREAIHAIGDASTANSSALAGGWIPTLVFGIPGDSVTAIVIGVLMMKNVTPGPAIFENQPALVYSIYLVFILANLVMLPIGWLAIRLGARIVRIPKPYLLPVIVLFCVTGSYALNGSLVDVTTMLVMGLIGYGLSRYGFPLGPVVLGLVLGGPLEERLIQSLTAAAGSPLGLVDRPIAIVLAVVATIIAVSVVIRGTSVGNRYSDREAGSR
ncbi:tripartite tricarboxylate transporter permease [Roseimaritima ulvae]|uniref:Tripartite tricarboxylate transporter TctA family protein n=1 Tax=Roseimaritima ulvae TaxID=980254 RepID=A0A5B9QPJ3_9BACT|nr:tripartite tricarboxylate transporter permease [Roseimaritima ulvae]QEG40874.1 Tripartite tricarboxylate transporter TctA family protein [Roseimaritima ulvae]